MFWRFQIVYVGTGRTEFYRRRLFAPWTWLKPELEGVAEIIKPRHAAPGTITAQATYIVDTDAGRTHVTRGITLDPDQPIRTIPAQIAAQSTHPSGPMPIDIWIEING